MRSNRRLLINLLHRVRTVIAFPQSSYATLSLQHSFIIPLIRTRGGGGVLGKPIDHLITPSP